MRIKFEDSGITEYAGLTYYNNNKNVMKGHLYESFNSVLSLIDKSKISLHIQEDGNIATVS